MKARALDVLGLLCIATGVFGLVNYVSDLISTSMVTFDMRILLLWTGYWLIKRDLRGYHVAVFISFAMMILTPTLLVLSAVIAMLASVQSGGADSSHVPWLAIALLSLVWSGLSAGLYYGLRRPQTRALFSVSHARGAQSSTTVP
ncbi:MAG: hypothetical protein IT353_24120 [Gemmatimonadaceae bacterium]|nr:hypothetical protein [Gemmatimonadaceae bacterium]